MAKGDWVSRLIRLAIAVLAALTCLSACQSGRLVESDAVRIAKEHLGQEAPLLLARHGEFGLFVSPTSLPGVSRTREVWAIVLGGANPGGCVMTPQGEVCPPVAKTTLVVIDDATGEIIMSESPADLTQPGFN